MDKNQEAFEALLLRLEPHFPDTEKRYKQLRTKMLKFFVWRRSEDPEGLADETISRALYNISTGEEIYSDNPYSYIYGIARYVFMEYIRDKKKNEALTSTLTEQPTNTLQDWQDCRKECLQKLAPDKRKLLEQYYTEEESREDIALALDISLNALRLQIHRIKQELRACQEECVK
jgi:DNA-directed RNA polymerase specialized sigma24 family protein